MYTRWFKRLTILVLLLVIAPAARPIFSDSMPTSLLIERKGKAAPGTPEQRILAAIDAIRAGQIADATATVEALLLEQPNYRLAHLLRGDLYAMRAMAIRGIGGGLDNKEVAAQLEDLRQEAFQRNQHRLNPPHVNKLPGNLLVFAPEMKHAILVDTRASRIYIYANDNGTPKYVTDFYATIGKLGFDKYKEGDQRTPLGVYFVTSHLPREQLDKTYGDKADLYGVGAWPLSYPNELDRSQGRTGHGIWLHGVPEATYARAPLASNGCVAMANPEMQKIAEYLQLGKTAVVIAPGVQWLTQDDWAKQRDRAMETVEGWRHAWAERQTSRYLNYYSDQFRSDDGQNLRTWSEQKASVNNSKDWVDIELKDLSIFAAGENGSQLVSSFEQDYRSNNLENRMKKRLYWQRDGQGWRIVWEGASNAG
ncbi:L,D-transpeptidase family protein [Chitinilyticum piscinae]|uniref:L,D-transpeptidase family protein n=1 Tax=Chitinilyticum piscinae TaxID=2866724 RepID=A0A8J7K962_9NEIS|nr:L,D-transpeptidase family protein [Chitinilyticum piscinae]MBE9610708.1 L,D-transpeptidase family protein [Chitinilyticum piscinae]